MSNLRMTSDLRRQLILGAAKRCFARNGFAGTTTKSVAAAAAISEGLLFKHFPSKAALYAEILAEECEADPDLAHLLGQAPSTATLVELVRGMVGHFMQISGGPDDQEAQRLRFMAASHLEDGEFARLLYAKLAELIGPTFTNSLESAIAAGDATRIGSAPLNLFWFAHHTVLTAALTRLPSLCPLPVHGGSIEEHLASRPQVVSADAATSPGKHPTRWPRRTGLWRRSRSGPRA